MADFSKIEVIDSPDGGVKIIFDLDNQTIKELEDALGIAHTSPDFVGSFQTFVEAGLNAYIILNGGANE